MGFQGPLIESIGLRRGGLWAGLLVAGGMAGVILPMLLGPGRPKGIAGIGLGLFTTLPGLVVYSCVKELFFGWPVIQVSAEGFAFRLGSGSGTWEVPWSRMRAIRMGKDATEEPCLDIEVEPDPDHPMPRLRLNAGGGGGHVLRFIPASLAGDLALTAQRLEAYRRSFVEGG